MRRFDSISRSPIYVHFNETISGATCIRAFGATERFIVQNEKLVDNNNIYIYANVSSWRSEVTANCYLLVVFRYYLTDNIWYFLRSAISNGHSNV